MHHGRLSRWRPHLLPRPDAHVLEQTSLGVWVAGGKGPRFGEVSEVEDDQAPVHRGSVVGEGRSGRKQLVTVLVEIGEVRWTVFLAHAEVAGLVGAKKDVEHACLPLEECAG